MKLLKEYRNIIKEEGFQTNNKFYKMIKNISKRYKLIVEKAINGKRMEMMKSKKIIKNNSKNNINRDKIKKINNCKNKNLKVFSTKNRHQFNKAKKKVKKQSY